MPMTMTLQELMEFSKSKIEFTEVDRKRISARFKELEDQFQKQAESMRPTSERMNRLYTL